MWGVRETLLKPDGLAFDNYEIGEFFQELLKKFTHVVILPAHQFCVIIVGKRVIYIPGSAEENGEIKEGEEMADMGADIWRIWLNLWQQCKKF